MKVLEHFLRSKVGLDLSSCEDAWRVTSQFACVVDGATSATGRTWTEQKWTSGKWAAEVLVRHVEAMSENGSDSTTASLPPSPRAVIHELSHALHTAYEQEGVLDIMQTHPAERPTASMVLYAPAWKQLVIVGDCQACLLSHQGDIVQRIQPTKYNDQVMAQARSMYLQLALAQGHVTQEQLLKDVDDPGRQFIEPLRTQQKIFQNNLAAPLPYRYWALDGFPIDEDSGMEIHPVPPDTAQIILASDGYPQLFSTLHETETYLQELIRKDPLLIHHPHLSTKGVRPGCESFDDRTYVRIEL